MFLFRVALVVILIFIGVQTEQIERVTKRTIHDKITSTNRIPSVICSLTEAGYLHITITPESVPSYIRWGLPNSMYGDWILGTASLYPCDEKTSTGAPKGEIYYRITISKPWTNLIAGIVQGKIGNWKLEDGSPAIRPEEMVWITKLISGLGKWLGTGTGIIIHYRPVKNEVLARLMMRISGTVVFDESIEKTQFERVINIFKRNCYEETIHKNKI